MEQSPHTRSYSSQHRFTSTGKSRLAAAKFNLLRKRLFGICLIMMLTGLAQAQGEDLEIADCYSVLLSPPIKWVDSAVWAKSHETILFVDTVFDKLMLLSVLTGRHAPADLHLGLESGLSRDLTLPWRIRAYDTGYFLFEDRSAEVFYLDKKFQLEAAIQINTITTSADYNEVGVWRLDVLWDFSPMKSGILAFADLRGPEGLESSGFLLFDSDGIRQIFQMVDVRDPVRNHYVRGTPYIATDEDLGYILFMEKEPWIGRIKGGVADVQPLPFFPKDFRHHLNLDQIHFRAEGPRRETAILKLIELSKTVRAIYFKDNYIYLLGKESISSSYTTAWWLIKLDPEDGHELSRTKLPTNAAHLTVVPGDSWSLIEKSPVEGLGAVQAPYMETSSIVIVPAKWLEGSGIPSVEVGAESRCTVRN